MYSDKAELDKFYTKSDVAKECLSHLEVQEYDLVIEPSAGGGAFFEHIKHSNKIGIDLSPEHPEVIEGDWFNYKIESGYKKVLLVGNPPFGKRNSLSKKFIIHGAAFSNVYTIAFILPDVYNKHTLQKHVPSDFRLKSIHKLKKDSFTINNEDYNVPCSFFIFERSPGLCLRFRPEEWTETEHWQYGTEREYDFFVMGAASHVTKDSPEKNNRGYYIKCKPGVNPDVVRENFRKMNPVTYSSANMGVAWQTKPELVRNYSRHLEKIDEKDNSRQSTYDS